MYSKVLIADDLGSINQGVLSVLDDLNIETKTQVQYCDDAYLKIKKAILDNTPYDLLITDLSFKTDYRVQTLSSGDELIDTITKHHPELPIIVYSIEDRLQRVKKILKSKNVIGYVSKGRKGLRELKTAITSARADKRYISPELETLLKSNGNMEFSDFDVALLNAISMGKSQSEISISFKEADITPSSLSAIEKRLNYLKIEFKANNTTHLIAITKDLGLI